VPRLPASEVALDQARVRLREALATALATIHEAERVLREYEHRLEARRARLRRWRAL
jgi:hypothetical protein